ncbi:MAG: isopeptide-forming domain-containing fimbrial protein, partial [Gammaproteobacteria bacterium]|nr:isopeptide-forming domain-containing fimbrial protein [Gammaproteobacteria bacterium]
EIPAGGCTIALDVTASDSTASPYVNTIAAGDLQTSVGDNGAEATASLFVNPPQPPSLSKYFSPSGIVVGGTSTLTLSFGNGNLADTTLTADLVDTLPSGVVVAANPNIQATNGCSAGSVSASAGESTVTVQSGASIPAGGCSISVDVTSSAPSESGHLNSIEAGALQTGFGNNAVATSARLKVSPLGIAKAVDGSTGPYAIGDEVTYTVSITVPAGIDTLSPFVVQDLTLTDALPDGLEYLTGSYVLTQSPDLDYAGPLPADFTVDGSNLTASLGTVTNASGEAQTFTIGYRLRVEDIPGNVAGTDLTNTATVGSADTTSTWDDDATVTVGEPALGIVKAISPDSDLTAGDEVTITLTVTNSGDVPAFDVVVTDILNDGTDNDLFDLAAAGIADTSTGAGADDFDFAYAEGTGTVTYTAQDGVSLAANGGQVIFTFTATVGPDIRTGWTYSNAASAIGNSQDGGTNGRETPQADSNTATVSTGLGAVSKVIGASSEPWTTSPQVAIGEVVTYRLSYTIPVGAIVSPADAAIFVDTLPSGQEFLSGTATIQASAAGVIIADGGQVTGVGNGEALPTSPTAITPTVDGRSQGFAVGNVQNTGAAAAQVIIELDVLMLNNSSNDHTDGKVNIATLNYVNRDGNTQSQLATEFTRIVEPLPAVTKTASPTSASGGDIVTFTVVASAVDEGIRTRLWDAVVTDTLPARYLSPTLTSAVLSRGNVDVSTCGGFAGQALTLTMDCLAAEERYLAPGETITLTYTATLDPNIAFEEVVTNTAQVRGTSLPGSNGTNNATPGTPDSDTGERTGSNALNTSGEAVNDLNASDNATLTANRPSVTKTVAQDSLQIGATTTQTITVSVPVGQTDDFVITDELPDGLRYTGATITIDLPASDFSTTNSPPTEPGADTDPLVFDFGTVVNSGTASQDIVISYEVEVENVIGNQRNTQLVNTATLNYSGASQPFPADDATITVREPALALSKTITAGTPAVAGSEVSYQLTVSNTDGFATAYQTDLTDVLPADLLGANGGAGPYFANVAVDNDSDAVVKSDGGDPLTAADADQSTSTDTLAWPLFDLPPNTTLTITYTATVVDGAVTGAILTNNVEAAYNSLPFGSDGRNGSDVLDDTDDTQLNNYGQTTSRDLTLDASIALQKTLSDGEPLDASYAIGEEVLFDVKVSLLAGITNNVIVTDTLPDGLQFLELVGINAESGISYNGAGTALEDPTGTVTVDLGDVTIEPAVADKSLTLQLRARVGNIASNQNGVDLTNGAEVASDIGSASDSLDVTVAEPVLQVTKTPDTTVPALGNQVTYTVEVSHTAASTADAYQVALTDLIPAGLTYQTGSTTGQASVDESDPAAPVFTLGQLANGATKSFSYRAEVDLDAVVGSALQNVIDGTFASTADATGA